MRNYNGDGLRASKTTGGTTTKFVYDTAQGMPLILNDGASSYLYGPGGVPFEQITTAGWPPTCTPTSSAPSG